MFFIIVFLLYVFIGVCVVAAYFGLWCVALVLYLPLRLMSKQPWAPPSLKAMFPTATPVKCGRWNGPLNTLPRALRFPFTDPVLEVHRQRAIRAHWERQQQSA